MYTTPKTFLDRAFGRWDNIKYVRHAFPTDVRDRMFFKIFGYSSKAHALPQKHGDFGKCEFWKAGFWRKENNGALIQYCPELL